MSSALERIEAKRNMIINQINELRAELYLLDNKKEELLHLTEVCPTCNGRGEERYTDAAGSGDWRECQTCQGLGKVKDLKCSCGKVTTVEMLRAYRERECPWCGRRLSF